MNVVERSETELVDAVLANWADWMHKDEPLAKGYPSTAAGMLVPSWIKDAEEAYEELDSRLMEGTDAAIDSLPRLSRLVIMAHFGFVPNVWNFHQKSLLYLKAKNELKPLLQKRGVI